MIKLLAISVAAVACVSFHAQAQEAPASVEEGQATQGPAIVVTARKPSVTNKIDRRVYDISARPDAFSTANDVLARIPSVTVDTRGRIALRGDSQVKVLIDGVDARPEVIANLRASDIDRIEVMTNPSAQFASEGGGGIINIILKTKRKSGLNGDLSVAGDDDGRYNLNGNIGYKAGRWTASAGIGSNLMRDIWISDGVQQWATPSGVETTTFASRTRPSRRPGHETIKVVYDASENDRLEFNFGNYHWQGEITETASATIVNSSGAVVVDQDETILTADKGYTTLWMATYVHKGKVEGERLNLNFFHSDGTTRDSVEHRLTRNAPTPDDTTYAYFNQSPNSTTSVRGDYERPFGTSRLTTGFSVETTESNIMSQSENIAAIVPSEADFDVSFLYDRRTLAAYGTWQTPLGRWVVMPGLRVESEQWDAGTSSWDDVRLLPSLNVNRPLTENLRITASYTQRTQRPELDQLNPRRTYLSRFLVYQGNPNLRSQDTDSYEVGYEFNRKTFNSNGSIYYRVNHNALTEARSIASDNQTVISSVINADESRATGVELSAKGKVTKAADYSVNLNVFDSEVRGVYGAQMLRRQYITWSGNAIVEYKPSSSDWVQFNLSGAGKTVTLQGYRTGFYRLDMAYRHTLTPKWTIAVNAFDLLNSSKQTYVFATPQGESQMVSRTKRMAIMIGISRKFGRSE